MNNEIDAEFTDINKESKYKNYIIVAILYLIVIILSVLLVFGLKNQKDVVENNINTETNNNQSVQPKTNTKDNNQNSNNEIESNILDQMGDNT